MRSLIAGDCARKGGDNGPDRVALLLALVAVQCLHVAEVAVEAAVGVYDADLRKGVVGKSEEVRCRNFHRNSLCSTSSPSKVGRVKFTIRLPLIVAQPVILGDEVGINEQQ
jgi:hypothetical protein